MDDRNVMDLLREVGSLADISMVSKVSRFEASREGKVGTGREIHIEILDHGEGRPDRFYVRAWDFEGRSGIGKGDSLDVAIRMVQWGDLTKPLPPKKKRQRRAVSP